MALNVQQDLDLHGQQILNVLLQALTSDPTGTESRFYYNSVAHELRFYNGTAWVAPGAGAYTNEDAQDAVATAIAAGTQVGLTIAYNDAANSLTWTVLPLNQLPTATANLSIGSNKITNLADGVSSQDAATMNNVTVAVAALVAAAPGALDTLNELAAALGNDPNFATTIATTISTLAGRVTVIEGNKYTTTIGDGTATSFVVTHSLGSRNVHISCYKTATPWDEPLIRKEHTSTTTCTLYISPAPTSGEYTVLVSKP